MRWPPVTVALLLAGCTFDGRGVPTSGGGGRAADAPPGPMIDAPRIEAADARPPDADPCPSGYVAIAGAPARYRVDATARTWLDAELDCEHDGLAHLAILRDDTERDAVRGATAGQVWLGVSDRVNEGSFVKVTGGAAGYLPWLQGEPNNLFNEDCVELQGGGFNDEGCGDTHGYACQCDGVAADPTTY